MTKLLVLSSIIAGSLIATTASAQVYVNAHIGFGIPARRVYVAPPPPPVVYQTQPVYQQPVYQDPAPAPVCQDGGYYDQPANVVYENDYPGYVYYNYPVWNGHYRDRVYYSHYRPYFERDNRGYFARGRFDRGRFERDHRFEGRGGYDRGGYDHRGRGRW